MTCPWTPKTCSFDLGVISLSHRVSRANHFAKDSKQKLREGWKLKPSSVYEKQRSLVHVGTKSQGSGHPKPDGLKSLFCIFPPDLS